MLFRAGSNVNGALTAGLTMALVLINYQLIGGEEADSNLVEYLPTFASRCDCLCC